MTDPTDTVDTTISSQINRLDSAIHDTDQRLNAIQQARIDLALEADRLKLQRAGLQGRLRAYTIMERLHGSDHVVTVPRAELQEFLSC